MDATPYAGFLRAVLQTYAQHNPSHGRIETHAVFDDERATYCIIDTGWDRGKRVHGLIFSGRIIDGKIRLEWDGLHYGITDELIQAGVPERDIVHAWMEPCPPEAESPRKKRETSDAPAPAAN